MIKRVFLVEPRHPAANFASCDAQLSMTTYYVIVSQAGTVSARPGPACPTLEIILRDGTIITSPLSQAEHAKLVEHAVGEVAVIFASPTHQTEGRRASLMLFHGKLAGLVLLEFRFANQAAADAFLPPDWMSGTTEVTGDDRYEFHNLAVHGIPARSG